MKKLTSPQTNFWMGKQIFIVVDVETANRVEKCLVELNLKKRSDIFNFRNSIAGIFDTKESKGPADLGSLKFKEKKGMVMGNGKSDWR